MNTTEIEQAFEEINAARIAMSEATAELRQELEEPQLRIASIEADSAEAARMMLIEDESLYEDKIMEDIYISDGEVVK